MIYTHLLQCNRIGYAQRKKVNSLCVRRSQTLRASATQTGCFNYTQVGKESKLSDLHLVSSGPNMREPAKPVLTTISRVKGGYEKGLAGHGRIWGVQMFDPLTGGYTQVAFPGKQLLRTRFMLFRKGQYMFFMLCPNRHVNKLSDKLKGTVVVYRDVVHGASRRIIVRQHVRYFRKRQTYRLEISFLISSLINYQ